MALSVSASNSYLLDNQEVLRNTAKNILNNISKPDSVDNLKLKIINLKNKS